MTSGRIGFSSFGGWETARTGVWGGSLAMGGGSVCGGGFLNIGGLERGRRVVDRERDSNPGRCSCDEVRRQHTAGITFVASSKKTFSKKKCIFRSELS